MTNEEIIQLRAKYGVPETGYTSTTPTVDRTAELDAAWGAEAPKSFGEKALDVAKSTVGGFASGVGGIALTAEDYLARKGVFGEKVKTAMEGQPSLQQQFKKEMGGEESPTAYGIGQLGGEIAALATPVGELGKVVGTGAKAIGAGKNVAKLAQAGTEGIAFTAGQSLTEGEKMPLKDYAINAGLNMLIPAGGIVSKKVGENLPSRIVNSLIKPLQKDFAYGKNPGKVIAEKGIIANNFEELITKVKQAKDETGNLIGELRSKSTTPITLDAESVITPIDQAIAKANLTPRTNAALVQRLESVRQDILDNLDNGLPPEKVKSLVGDLTKWTGNATDDQLVNKSLKGVYSSINSQMDNALKTGLSPEDFAAYKKANEQYGDLIAAENASIYRDKILERQDLISFGAKNAGLITALSTAIVTGGSAIPTILAGLGGTILDKTMATPAFKTRLAVLLSKLAPAEVNTFFDRVPTAKTIFKKEELDNLINRVKETPNKQGGFISLGGTQDDVLSLLKKQDKLTTISNQSDEVVRKFADNNGLVPDSVKNNPDYIKASNEAKKAFQDLRNFNASSEGKKLQSEMKKLGIVERQKLRKSLSQDANLPMTTQSSQTINSVKNTVIPKSSPKSATKSIDPLINEAKKYKSADDYGKAIKDKFIKEQGFEPSSMKVVDEWWQAKQTQPYVGIGGANPDFFAGKPSLAELPKKEVSKYLKFTPEGKAIYYRGISKDVKTRGIRWGDFISPNKGKASLYGKVERYELDPKFVKQLGDFEAVYFNPADKLIAPKPLSISEIWKLTNK